MVGARVQGHGSAVMVAMVLTECGVEGEGSAPVAHGWIVFLQPRHAENDVMGGRGDVQAQGFFVASDAEGEGIVLGNCLGLAPIGKG